MIKTQIQLPDALYHEAKRVAAEYGVTELATTNLKDFEGFGFRRVWNPLAEQ